MSQYIHIHEHPFLQLHKQATAGEGRHAVLHDFCMTIPYGTVAGVGGLVSLLFGAEALGWQVAGAGAVVLLSSVLSLNVWRSGGAAQPFTLLSAGRLPIISSWQLVHLVRQAA